MSDLLAATRLLLIAAVCAALLGLTHWLTAPRIADNQSQKSRDDLRLLLGTEHSFSTEELPDVSAGGDCWYLPAPGLYLHRMQTTGYGGPMTLLATLADGRLERLRVTAHQETPGIADFLNRPDTGWMARLRGQDHQQLGAIDTVSGATITSRALLNAIINRTAGAEMECRR
ncbi:MAG: FMN-binding protein [Pseudomonadales bacterium]|nr:FMN-binding protein [Pseudomonadales bacterium]